MSSWGFICSLVSKLAIVLALGVVSGCVSGLPPTLGLLESGVEVGPTLNSPHVIRVCTKPPGVPRHKYFWAHDGSGRLILDDWELGLLQRNGQRIYYFDENANPESARMLPIPHNTLQCTEPPRSVLSSTGKVTPAKPKSEVQPPPKPAVPTTTTARIAEPPPCTTTSEAGQKRSRSTTNRTCVRARTLTVASRPAPTAVAKSEVESPALAQAVPEPALTPPSLADWKVGAPNFSVPALDPQRVLECVGSLCHARHQNFAPKGSKPAANGVRESRSLPNGGGGGAKAPQTRKPPTGPKPAATAKPAQPGTIVKPKSNGAPKLKEPNRNRVDDRPATRYEKVDKDGNLLKHGVTHHEKVRKRYTEKQIGEGDVLEKERGPRREIIKKERELVETNPGPENREPWAGKRKPPQTGGEK